MRIDGVHNRNMQTTTTQNRDHRFITFKIAKNGRRRATYFSYGRNLPVALAEAELKVATGEWTEEPEWKW
jgi:hypothetical protein